MVSAPEPAVGLQWFPFPVLVVAPHLIHYSMQAEKVANSETHLVVDAPAKGHFSARDRFVQLVGQSQVPPSHSPYLYETLSAEIVAGLVDSLPVVAHSLVVAAQLVVELLAVDVLVDFATAAFHLVELQTAVE